MAAKKPWKPRRPYSKLAARSRRLEVRPYRETDFEAWRAGHLGRAPKIHRFDERTVKRSEVKRASFARCLREHRLGAKKQERFIFGIFERSTGAIVGFIGFYVIHPGLRWANLGYSVHNQYWGSGFGPEASKLCLELGFGPLHFHRIEASCDPRNKPSAKTALRAGLKPEGRRKKFFSRDGGTDIIVFAQNQIDWRKCAR